MQNDIVIDEEIQIGERDMGSIPVCRDDASGIRYVSFGSGKKVMVVVPGLSTGYVTDAVEVLESVFSDFTDDYTVYVFDVREQVPEGYTISRMGEDLVSVMKSLGLSSVYMYGCSMGGMVSLYVAGKHPELVSKLAAASSACKANEVSDRVFTNWISLAKEGRSHELTENMGKLIYSGPVYEANREVFSAMADGLTEASLARFISTAEAMVNVDLTEEASAIKCPVLALGALGDKVFTASGPMGIAEVTGAELFMFGEAYPHAVYDEAADLRSRVKDFFDRKIV